MSKLCGQQEGELQIVWTIYLGPKELATKWTKIMLWKWKWEEKQMLGFII